jgi:hypothetical protein
MMVGQGMGIDMLGARLCTYLITPNNCVKSLVLAFAGKFYSISKGSKLNNFLTENSGRRAIVFLDKIERTAPEIMGSLLIVLDEGTNGKCCTGIKDDNRPQVYIMTDVSETILTARR